MSVDALAHLIEAYGYWLLIPLAIAEGPIVCFVAGALSSLGYFNPFIAFIIFIAKDIGVDGAYYFLGHASNNTEFIKVRLARWGITEARIATIRDLWDKNAGKAMFFSKLSFGLSPIFLTGAGIIHTPYAKFLKYCALIAFVQYGVMFGLGLYFGSSFGSISGIVKKGYYAVAGLTLIALVLYLTRWYLDKKFEAENMGTQPIE